MRRRNRCGTERPIISAHLFLERQPLCHAHPNTINSRCLCSAEIDPWLHHTVAQLCVKELFEVLHPPRGSLVVITSEGAILVAHCRSGSLDVACQAFDKLVQSSNIIGFRRTSGAHSNVSDPGNTVVANSGANLRLSPLQVKERSGLRLE